MKKLLRTTKSGVIDYLRDTPAYGAYCRAVGKRNNDSTTLAFYQRLVRDLKIAQDVWFDVGANIGGRSTIFSRLAKRVVSMEPDPKNIARLRRRFGFRKNVTIVAKAVGESSGTEKMLVGAGAYSTLAKKEEDIAGASSRLSLHHADVHSIEVPVLSLDELIATYGLPSYIKVDVEGYEEVVFRGLSKKVALVSFESNLPDCLRETITCIEKLTKICPGVKFNYAITEPPEKLVSESWLTPDEMIGFAKNSPSEYLEIFAWAA